MSHVSLARKWILLSLVLLSPDILATESLNYHYKRADTLSLEPRLGLQARACHSKADPMDITFRNAKGIDIKKPYKVILSISGGAYAKSYAVFSPSSAKNDGSFLVPWGANAKGEARIEQYSDEFIPGHGQQNSDPFCFSTSSHYYHSGNINGEPGTLSLLPIFKNPPYFSDQFGRLTKADFEKICQPQLNWYDAHPGYQDNLDYYWPTKTSGGHDIVAFTEIEERTGSGMVANNVREYGGRDGLAVEVTHHIFFTKRTAVADETVKKKELNSNTMIQNCTDSTCNFNLINGEGLDGNLALDDGSFLVRLNNRNITLLTLTLVYDKKTYTWNWQLEQGGSSLATNKLTLVNSTEGSGIVLPKAIDDDDPYNGFYKDGTKSIYRGTLVTNGSLNMDADDKKDTIPLSLPANIMGDINLVNTESLTFTLGSDSNGAPTLAILGQPLKFAPITVNGKEAASAMQVRNACY